VVTRRVSVQHKKRLVFRISCLVSAIPRLWFLSVSPLVHLVYKSEWAILCSTIPDDCIANRSVFSQHWFRLFL
jgi:hypothetical protein